MSIRKVEREDLIRVNSMCIDTFMGCGFKCTGEIGESAGLKYQPMEMDLHK